MKESIHPQWATKFRKPGTELRKINNRYYLYQVTNKWNKETKRSKKITGRLLGSITEKEGFKESDKYKLSKKHFSEPLQVKEFGASNFIENHFKEYIEKLKISFPDIWQEIVSLAAIRLLHHSSIKGTAFWFEKSFLSETFSEISLGEKRVSALYRKIGTNRNAITSFMKQFIESNDSIIFDGTQFISHSKLIEDSKIGYSSKHNFEPQMNILFLFSVNNQKPLFYRLLPINITDVKAFKLKMQEAELKQATVIADKGFYSEDNIQTMDNFGLQYIIPLRRTNSLINYSTITDPLRNDFDGFFEHQKRFIWYKKIQFEEKIVFLYLDKQLKSTE